MIKNDNLSIKERKDLEQFLDYLEERRRSKEYDRSFNGYERSDYTDLFWENYSKE